MEPRCIFTPWYPPRSPNPGALAGRLIALLGLAGVAAVLLCGCASNVRTARLERPFMFSRDTMAFTNELVWEYGFDAKGRWSGRPRDPKPSYANRCFPLVCSVRQFFFHARFDPGAARVPEEDYRRLVRRVLGRSPRQVSADDRRIAIPGYADLRSFSIDHEGLLKAECGAAWESYFQRGHWRMVFPFSRRHQAKTAQEMLETLGRNVPPALHIATFPELTINHAILAFGAREEERAILFETYDPNYPQGSVTLTFDRESRTFSWPASNYYPGAPLDVYQVYHRWNY